MDLNALLYHCNDEEKATTGFASYDIPKYGPLVYCGIASLFQLLETIREGNDMGHPLFDNLREGNWLMDFIVDRLSKYPQLKQIENWLRAAFNFIQQLPR